MDQIITDKKRPMRRSKPIIQSILQDYAAHKDQLSKLEFCESRGVNYGTFTTWLKQDSRSGRYSGRKGRFIEVIPEISETVAEGNNSDAPIFISITKGDLTIRFHQAVTAEYIHRLIHVALWIFLKTENTLFIQTV